jgi:hypothetical protein
MKGLPGAARWATALLLTACSAVGVPPTDDPWQKYLYGCALLDSGRVFPAERLLSESLAHYERSGQPLQLAMVQMSYATLVESPAFVVDRQFHEKRMALGGREALSARSRAMVATARENLQRALEAPSAQGSPAERTQVLIMLAEAQSRLGDRVGACSALEQAHASHVEGAGVDYPYATYRYRSVPELLEARTRALGCSR